jgi:SAM-dependent methyltransferase
MSFSLLNLARRVKRKLLGTQFEGSSSYWERRYAAGGNSGSGSYGRLALYKAQIINKFVEEHKIRTVLEFGCGDGHQLSLANYPQYTGLDVSPTVIQICKDRFRGNTNRNFRVYDPLQLEGLAPAELGLSLDVIYHLVEDRVYEDYMQKLFLFSEKYVIIYASDREGPQINHERMRKFTRWVSANRSEWKLSEHIKNPYPYDSANPADRDNTSQSDFFIYKKSSV